ncbi:MAG: phytanoyl-CoA dioxygenase family protein [Chthonomonadales bacterium]|nr:phytanoyl-CoA dioxygenase family protein [Chthonomonadales bacterium]
MHEEHARQFERDGYAVVRGLFAADEADRLRDHFMLLREAGAYPGDSAGVDSLASDPLKRYPRMIHMHRWDETSLRWLLDPRICAVLTALLGREPFAVQTMLYFKPPGARGQALHQDQYYLRAAPGTCMAAWLALDACDEANGCMRVVPGSHRWPMLCAEKADTAVSFTDVTVPLLPEHEVRPVPLAPGDTLLFNGALVHGSYPNATPDRFRRALIGHYIEGQADRVASYYHPVLRMDGAEVELGNSTGGGQCGVWVDRGAGPDVEMRETVEAP